MNGLTPCQQLQLLTIAKTFAIADTGLRSEWWFNAALGFAGLLWDLGMDAC